MLRRASSLLFVLLVLVVLPFLLASCSSPEAPPAVACNYHEDCPNQGACFEGTCHPTASCLERSNCNTVPVCEGQRCICPKDTHRCVPVCVTDENCPSDGQCVDGICKKYPADFSGMPPSPRPMGQLYAGTGRVELDFPLGVSLAGYATRQGPRTPYQDLLGGSNAWFGKPDVRALALQNGEDLVVLLRSPTCWASDELLAATVLKIKERTGLDLLDRLVLAAPHSHSYPARYWHMLIGQNLGVFGYDEFSFEIFDRITTSLAEAVITALDSLEPARFGYAILDDFDPDVVIHRDRRHRNNGLPNHLQRDDRMALLRVDDANGAPLAIVANFGVHPTIFDYDNPIVTGDASAGIEVAITEQASAKYGRPVLGIFFQSDAGDMSPSADRWDHSLLEQVQLIGRLTWKVIDPALDQITTDPAAGVDVVSGRVPISREALGYTGMEFHDPNVVCENSPPYFRYGAFQCVEGLFDDEDPATKFSDGNLACIFAVECLTSGFPIPQFMKTHLSTVRLGELVLATLPGEPLSQFGRSLSERVKAAVPSARDATVLGYAQDYHFYLLDEDDWFQGGYEASRAIWGWKFAPYLADRAVELAAELERPKSERMPPRGNLKPMLWDDPPDTKTPVSPTETEGDPAQILTDVPAQVERMKRVEFVWAGGHPGVDRPRIVLETATGMPLTKAGGLAYDDSGFEMLVHYDGDCSRSNCTKHAWRVDWEESRSFPLGSYRFHATGRALSHGTVVDYDAISSPFELIGSTALSIDQLELNGTRLSGRVLDPALADGHLLRDFEIPARMPRPVIAMLDFSVLLSDSSTVTASSLSPFAIDLPPGANYVRISVHDPFGNTGKAP